MSAWTRERIDPIEYMRRQGWRTSHITYNPRLRKGDYSIIRGSAHDGTLLFTLELIQKALEPLAAKASYHKPREQEFTEKRERVRYEVGPLRIATVFGQVDLPVGRRPGVRQRVRIPVRMTFA